MILVQVSNYLMPIQIIYSISHAFKFHKTWNEYKQILDIKLKISKQCPNLN